MNKPFGAPVKLTELGVNGYNRDLRLLPDLLTGVFASSRDGGVGYSDIWETTRASSNGAFQNIAHVGVINVAKYSQYSPTISGDGLTMVFDVQNASYPGQLWLTSRPTKASDFSPPTLMTINTPAEHWDPYLREDGQELYFASQRNGSTFEIFRSPLVNKVFSTPATVVELNDMKSDKTNPVVTPDDLVLYFSNVAVGTAGWDVLRATRDTATGVFTNIQSVAEVNTPDAERPSFITADRCTLYLTRSRGPSLLAEIFVASKTP